MTKNDLLSSSRRRPKRQRTPTTLYSDDNPSTFTIKVKKDGRPVELPPPTTVQSLISPKHRQQQQPNNKPRVGRPRKVVVEAPEDDPEEDRDSSSDAADVKGNSNKPSAKSSSSSSSSMMITMSDIVASPRTAANKRMKRMRATTSGGSSSDASTAASSFVKQPPQDSPGTLLPHSISVIPIFDSVAQRLSAAASSSKTTEDHKSNTSSKNKQQQQQPEWKPLYDPPVFFEQDYSYPEDDDEEEADEADVVMKKDSSSKLSNSKTKTKEEESSQEEEPKIMTAPTLDPTLPPVTRSVTCLTVRRPDHDYMAVGDDAGFLTVYTLGSTLIRPVARLESVACSTKAISQQAKIRDCIRKQKGTCRLDTSQTAIHAMAFCQTRVVLATALELECVDIPSQTSLWVCPIVATQRIPTALDMHPESLDVLVSSTILSREPPPAAAAAPTSPLMLLQQSQQNVEICDANTPVLVQSPCCTAIWDNSGYFHFSSSHKKRLLFITPTPSKSELELVLVSSGDGSASIDQWKVACKTTIALAENTTTNNPTGGGIMLESKLTQSPTGAFTLVASSRGIRLYDTETLSLMHVYGDQLALHGKTLKWADCLVVGHGLLRNPNKAKEIQFYNRSGANNSASSSAGRQHSVLEYPDVLNTNTTTSSSSSGPSSFLESIEAEHNTASAKNESSEKDTATTGSTSSSNHELGIAIVGVPHPTQGPDELCRQLHVWNLDQAATTVPHYTIPLPGKEEGVNSVLSTGSSLQEMDRLVVCTNKTGKAYTLDPTVRSNFAGIMYPTGYQVIDSNLEYIEEEDELDQEVVVASSENDKDYAKRRPILDEDSEAEGVDAVDVVDDDLREAMRRSLVETKQADVDPQEMIVHVVDDEDEANSHQDFGTEIVPCRPELYLQQAPFSSSKDNATDDETNANNSADISAYQNASDSGITLESVLRSMPHAHKIPKPAPPVPKPVAAPALAETSDNPGGLFQVTVKTMIQTNAIKPAANRGKRSRAANIEAMLKQSINPALQAYMKEQQEHTIKADGKGSRFTNIPPAVPTIGTASAKPAEPSLRSTAFGQDEKAVVLGLLGLSPTNPSSTAASESSIASERAPSEDGKAQAETSKPGSTTNSSMPLVNNCPACRGRWVIHSCGTRSLPIDLDEVVRQEQERKAAAKKKARAEKKRLQELEREKREKEQREREEREKEQMRKRMEAEAKRRQEAFMAEQRAAAAAAAAATAAAPPRPDYLVPPSVPGVNALTSSMEYASHHHHAAAPVAATASGYHSAPVATSAYDPGSLASSVHRASPPADRTASLTLSAGEALAALASFATAPAPPPHGFSSALSSSHQQPPAPSSTSPHRSIPSYASLNQDRSAQQQQDPNGQNPYPPSDNNSPWRR